MKHRRYESLISTQLWMMRPGESVTFTRQLDSLPVTGAPNKLSQMINSYTFRRRPGCTWKMESFATVTHAGNLFVGVIVTLLTEPLQNTETEE